MLLTLLPQIGNTRVLVRRQRELLHTLAVTVAADRATAGERWAPYYERALAELDRIRDHLVRNVERAAIGRYTGDFSFHAQRLLQRHLRLCELLAGAAARGCSTLGDAWQTCSELETATLLLLTMPDIPELTEPLRQAVILHMHHSHARSPAARAYLDAALAASRGYGSHDAVERAHAIWEAEAAASLDWYNGGELEWHNELSALPRHATLAQLGHHVERIGLARLKEHLPNPFRPLAGGERGSGRPLRHMAS
jgi:hypothetical protein